VVPPQSLEEWEATPELPIPLVHRASDPGFVYRVLAIAGLWLPPEEAEEQGLDGLVVADVAPDGEAERLLAILPTVSIDGPDGPVHHRLPLALGEWVLLQMNAASVAEGDLFPAEVEFRQQDGEYQAVRREPPAAGGRAKRSPPK
jgi:hypothetical protein